MDANTFREFGKAAVDFIADYMENIRDCDVLPSVEPGYLVEKLPKTIPEQPEHWQEVLKDINDLIKPGITHWQSPNFHAFYPTASSYPSMVGDMIASGFSVIGFNWICSPACTELEVVVMDWLAKFLKLPEHFLHSSTGPGGGIIQGSASEAVLVAILAAREQAVKKYREVHYNMSESEIRGKLLAYSSNQSNSCIEKSGILAAMPMKLLPADDNFMLRGETLRQAVMEDIANGYFPVICIATLGTTGTCATDDIEELAVVCEENGIWLHVDAAYAGAALALDEYTELRRGLDKVDSLNFNLHKSLMINFDCGAMWLRNANLVEDSFTVNREYLKHVNEQEKPIVPDFRHWQIPLGRRFRAMKVWVTFRTIGAEGLRAHVRNYIHLAKRFEDYVRNDARFEIVAKPAVGLVCFRVKGANRYSIELLKRITERKKIYMVQAKNESLHFLRFVICGMEPKEQDVDFAWHEIQTQLQLMLEESDMQNPGTNMALIQQNKRQRLVEDAKSLDSLNSNASFLNINNIDNYEKSK